MYRPYEDKGLKTLTWTFWTLGLLVTSSWLFIGFSVPPKPHRMASEGAAKENMGQTIKEKNDAP